MGDPGREIDRREHRLRQSRQACVRVHESRERLRAGLDDQQPFARFLGRRAAARDHGAQTAGDTLDRCERVIDLMRQHADQPQPGLPFLFPQCTGQIGEQQQHMRTAVLDVVAPSEFPASRGASQTEFEQARRVTFQRGPQPQPSGLQPQHTLGRTAEHALPFTVHEPQPAVGVEPEHGDVDRVHDPLQQRRRRERTQPMVAYGFGECVDLEQGQPQCTLWVGMACADRRVALADGGHHVGDRLHGAHRAFDRKTDADERAAPQTDQQQRAQRFVHCGA